MSDCIDERGMRPRLKDPSGLGGGDDVSGGLFDYAEAVEPQLAEDRSLPCSWRAGDDEPSYVVIFFQPEVATSGLSGTCQRVCKHKNSPD